MPETAFLAPRLTLRVGVTGHRPDRLAGADPALLARRADEVLACLAQTVRRLQQENDASGGTALFAPGGPDLRLATAVAEGADRIVTQAAIGQGYGLNLVLPFPRDIYARDFAGTARDVFEALCAHPAVQSTTELDLSQTPGDPLAYRAAGLLVLDHADVLIAVWDGGPAAGPGGTAEIVEEARRRGLVTVLIRPTGEVALWTVPEVAVDPLAEGEWTPLPITSGALCADTLVDRVRALLMLPAADGRDLSPAACLARFAREPLREGTRACGYALLRGLFLPGRRFPTRVDHGLARERAEAWKRTLAAAEATGGPAFRERLDARLRERWIRADNLALHFSHLFRSAFVTNFLLAAVAVALGLLALFAWKSAAAKAVFTALELVAIGLVLYTTGRARRQHWHELWLDARSLAEALRPARLPLLLGGSPVRPGESVGATAGQEWVAWYVRAALREIPPPTAVLDRDAMRRVVEVARAEEVAGQRAYHEANARDLAVLDRRLHATAQALLWATVAAGGLYLLLFGVASLAVRTGVEHGAVALLAAYKPLATFLAGTLPVFGAAVFGIRATADFRTAVRQSRRMTQELDRLGRALAALDGRLSGAASEPLAVLRQRLSRLLARLGRALAEDVRLWGMVYSERELVAGF